MLPRFLSDHLHHATDLSSRGARRAADIARALVSSSDQLGFDRGFVEPFVEPVDALCRSYFRQEIRGFERVVDGPALVVANHNSGITWLEPFGFVSRWYLERGYDDPIHFLMHDVILKLPGLGQMFARSGGLVASHDNGVRILEAGRKLLVAPGGDMEAFRPYSKRYRVDFGPRRGYIRLALRAGVPIQPVVFCGGHEIFFVLSDGRKAAEVLRLQQLFRLGALPVTLGLPWGLFVGPIFHLPLPAKSTVEILDPVDLSGYGPAAAEDPAALDALHAEVMARMQRKMDDLASERRFPVIG